LIIVCFEFSLSLPVVSDGENARLPCVGYCRDATGHSGRIMSRPSGELRVPTHGFVPAIAGK
jgi:hypothetical protein